MVIGVTITHDAGQQPSNNNFKRNEKIKTKVPQIQRGTWADVGLKVPEQGEII